MDRQRLYNEFQSFKKELRELFGDEIHSIYVIGSYLNDDFLDNASDLNSVVIFNKLRFSFVQSLSTLGKKYRKKRIAAPWLMDPEYISRSLDSFPLEFLNFKLLHRTEYGEDIFATLVIDKKYLRLQIEREIKSKLIWLRQGYLSAMGQPPLLADYLKSLAKALVPVLRGICYIYSDDVPVESAEKLFDAMESLLKRKSEPLYKAWLLRNTTRKPSKAEIDSLYESLYEWLSRLSREIDEAVL